MLGVVSRMPPLQASPSVGSSEVSTVSLLAVSAS